MAAIDKIYIGWEDYCKLKEWCKEQPPIYDKYGTKCYIISYLWDLKKENFFDNDGKPYNRPVMDNPYYIDYYIIKNCPIQGVQDAVSINYGHRPQSWLREAYEIVKNRKPEVQKLIDEANGNYPSGSGLDAEEFYYWYWNIDDFHIDENGFITVKDEKSEYEMIRDGEIELSPSPTKYIPGKHCRMIEFPRKNHNWSNFETCYRGDWMVEVKLPEDIDERYMWYHNYEGKKSGTWDFPSDFVSDAYWSSSCAHVHTIKALKRKIRKWNLPIGTKVIALGRYKSEHYEFIVTK